MVYIIYKIDKKNFKKSNGREANVDSQKPSSDFPNTLCVYFLRVFKGQKMFLKKLR